MLADVFMMDVVVRCLNAYHYQRSRYFSFEEQLEPNLEGSAATWVELDDPRPSKQLTVLQPFIHRERQLEQLRDAIQSFLYYVSFGNLAY